MTLLNTLNYDPIDDDSDTGYRRPPRDALCVNDYFAVLGYQEGGNFAAKEMALMLSTPGAFFAETPKPFAFPGTQEQWDQAEKEFQTDAQYVLDNAVKKNMREYLILMCWQTYDRGFLDGKHGQPPRVAQNVPVPPPAPEPVEEPMEAVEEPAEVTAEALALFAQEDGKEEDDGDEEEDDEDEDMHEDLDEVVGEDGEEP